MLPCVFFLSFCAPESIVNGTIPIGHSTKTYFFSVLDTRLCFGQFFNKREKSVKWNIITAAPTRAVVGAAWMSHFTSPHFISLHFTSLHWTSLHFTALHFTSLHFTSLHFTSVYFTSLQFRTPSASHMGNVCLLYTSPSPRDVEESRMPSSA